MRKEKEDLRENQWQKEKTVNSCAEQLKKKAKRNKKITKLFVEKNIYISSS